MTKISKKYQIRKEVERDLISNISNISIDTGFSPFTIRNWIKKINYKLAFPIVMESITKHTGLTADQIFEPTEE